MSYPFPLNFLAWGVVIVALLAATLIIALVIDALAYALEVRRIRRAARRRNPRYHGWSHDRRGSHQKNAWACGLYARHWHVGPIIIWNRKGD